MDSHLTPADSQINATTPGYVELTLGTIHPSTERIPAMARYIRGGREWVRKVGRDAAIAALKGGLAKVPSPYPVAVTRWRVNTPVNPKGGRPFDPGYGRIWKGTLAEHDRLISAGGDEVWAKKQGHPYGLTLTNWDGHSNLDVLHKTGLVLDCDNAGEWDTFQVLARDLGLTVSWHRSGGNKPGTPKWHAEVWLSKWLSAPPPPVGVREGSPAWKSWADVHTAWVNTVWKPQAGHLTGVFAELCGLGAGTHGCGFDPAVPEHVGGILYPPHRRSPADEAQTGNGYQDTGLALNWRAALAATGYVAPAPTPLVDRKPDPTAQALTDAKAEGLVKAFEAWGKLIRLQGEKAIVMCPWESEHSGGRTGDSSTVILPGGAFKCSHGHCIGRHTSTVLDTMPSEIRAIVDVTVATVRDAALASVMANLDAMPGRTPEEIRLQDLADRVSDEEQHKSLQTLMDEYRPDMEIREARAREILANKRLHLEITLGALKQAKEYKAAIRAHYQAIGVPEVRCKRITLGLVNARGNRMMGWARACGGRGCFECGPDGQALRLAGALHGPVTNRHGAVFMPPLVSHQLHKYVLPVGKLPGFLKTLKRDVGDFVRVSAYEEVASGNSDKGSPLPEIPPSENPLHGVTDVHHGHPVIYVVDEINATVTAYTTANLTPPAKVGRPFPGCYNPVAALTTSEAIEADVLKTVLAAIRYTNSTAAIEGLDGLEAAPEAMVVTGKINTSRHLHIDPETLVKQANPSHLFTEARGVGLKAMAASAARRGLDVKDNTRDSEAPTVEVSDPPTRDVREAIYVEAGGELLRPKAKVLTYVHEDPTDFDALLDELLSPTVPGESLADPTTTAMTPPAVEAHEAHEVPITVSTDAQNDHSGALLNHDAARATAPTAASAVMVAPGPANTLGEALVPRPVPPMTNWEAPEAML